MSLLATLRYSPPWCTPVRRAAPPLRFSALARSIGPCLDQQNRGPLSLFPKRLSSSSTTHHTENDKFSQDHNLKTSQKNLEIKNKGTILQTIDEIAGVTKPPALEYLYVQPAATLRFSRNSASSQVRFSLPSPF